MPKNAPPRNRKTEAVRQSDRPSNCAQPPREEPEKSSVAVALAHDGRAPDSVPRVLATGRGEFAEIILDIAFRNGVKVRQDADLAEILAAVDLDSEIPVEAFIAVAEILRYVYASNGGPTDATEPRGAAPAQEST